MRCVRKLKGVASVVIALSLVLVAACTAGCGGAAPPAQDAKTAPPASGQDVSPPGRLTISAATASSGSETAAFAVDHDLQMTWNSGMFAPGWIQLDLGQPSPITSVRLYAAQKPAGPTTHQILGGLTPDSLALLGTLDGDTADAQWLELQTKGEVRYLKVVTVKSPSWVGWREIEVYD
ncbi:MAG TPA: discoidin domain-containing protein [Gemmatimonadaceae bacterium]|nr:discoidin domain-containing protein [Gemmatimonadaceae bacterium]